MVYGSEDEIQTLFKYIEFSSMYVKGTWDKARKVEIYIIMQDEGARKRWKIAVLAPLCKL